jgi:methylated-DNA-protein-cysteine methyltransferase-like protein
MVDEIGFDQLIWQTIMAIPPGSVASYGEIARRAGLPGGARRVGRALRILPAGSVVPWYRVINAQGKSSLPPGSPSYVTQRERLEAEGVEFSLNGKVDFKRFGWRD